MIHITKQHSGKMTGFWSISVSTLENAYCQVASKNPDCVCSKCYAAKYEKMRKTLEKKLVQNSIVFSNVIIPEEKLPIINHPVCRFNSFGELYNLTHLINLVNICNKNPDVQFTLWTKRANFIRYIEKPKNLILIYSNPKLGTIIKDVPVGFDKTFNVVGKDMTKYVNCHSNCAECMKCYSENNINVIIEKVK